MNKILLLILLLLMIYVGGKRGVKLFFACCLNFFLLILIFYFITIGFNPIIITILGCLLFSLIILYFVNGENIKTKTSLHSVCIILIVLLLLIIIISKNSLIAGFGSESFEEINMFSYDIDIDFTNITISLILIGLVGATIDSAISISSSLYEIYINNKKISKQELFKSGLNIGKDILGTTVNTLFFAFLGEFLTLILWFKTDNYCFSEIINNKTFAKEIIKIMFSIIGSILVIPLTAYITSYKLKKEK